MKLGKRQITYLLIIAAAILVLVELGFFETKQEREARLAMKKLSALTLKTFPTGQPAMGEIFWRAVGEKEPRRDPWGTYYEISLSTKHRNEFVWRSAGPDKTMRTGDDLKFSTTYNPPITR